MNHKAHKKTAIGTVDESNQSVKEGSVINASVCTDGREQQNGTFKKDMGWIGVLAAGYNLTNCWLVVAATMTVSLPYGPMTTIWGIIVIMPIYLCIGLTLAELISAYPTTGGQYHWTSILAPAKINRAMVSALVVLETKDVCYRPFIDKLIKSILGIELPRRLYQLVLVDDSRRLECWSGIPVLIRPHL